MPQRDVERQAPFTARRKPAKALAVLAGALFLAGCAGGTATLGDKLDTADRRLIAETTQAALEQEKIGTSRNWDNPATGHRGSVTPFRTYQDRAGRDCREFQQTIAVDGETTVVRDAACRGASGAWQSVNYDSLASAAVGAWPNRRDDRYDPYRYDNHYPYYGYSYFGYPYYRHGYRPSHRRRPGHGHRSRFRFGLFQLWH